MINWFSGKCEDNSVRKNNLFIKLWWDNWLSTCEGVNLTLISHCTQQLTQNGQRPNVSAKTITLLEENIEVNLCDLGLENGFLDMTPKHKQQQQK